MFESLKTYSLGDSGEVDISMHVGSGYRYAHLLLDHAPASLATPAAMLVVPTPAADNSGATHALEHMVLCGSQKYHWRDAFFRMERRSVALHLNAVTNEWLSTFHFCTPSQADFSNLVEFLMDGVFNPLLSDETFASEVVRRLSPASESFTGVVYNEMKALTAMPGLALDLAVRSLLYPDSAFGYLSGGDPAAIATLEPNQVRAFHQHHYNLSKAWLISSGDIDHLQCQQHLDSLLPSQRSTESSVNSAIELSPFQPQTDNETDNIFVPGGIDAAVLCWDRGWSADETALLESYLLLDLLVSRPDSLLRQNQAVGTVAAAHLNVVDSQASRIAMRLGFGQKSNERNRLPNHDQLLNEISSKTPTQQHLDQALDRIEILYSSGDLRGAAVNSIGRLRRTAEILCASAPESERQRWFNETDPIRRLRERFESPSACGEIFKRLSADIGLQRLHVVGDAKHSTSAKSTSTLSGVEATESITPRGLESVVDQSLPIVDVAQVPVFPSAAFLERIDANRVGSTQLFAAKQALDGGRVRLTGFFKLDDVAATNIAQLICRLDYEASQGVLCELVSTRFEIDSWACGNVNDGVGVGGISVNFAGLARNAEEVLLAFRSLLALNLEPDQVSATDLLTTLRRSRSTRLEAMLRTGHVSAVSAALRQSPGWQFRHYGSGLGLLARDREQFWTPIAGTLRDRLYRVVVDAGDTIRSRFESALLDDLAPLSGLSPKPVASNDGSSIVQKPDPTARRSLFRVPGSVNYVARVMAIDSKHPSSHSSACLLVLAAAARNCHLLDAIRVRGGAYGTGVEVMSNVLALWSYRDPRLADTFADFDTAIEKLAANVLVHEQLLEAKLCALTQLNKRFLPEYRNANAQITLIEEYDAGRRLVELYTAIDTVQANDIRVCAKRLIDLPRIDAALTGSHWKAEDDLEFSDFDFRDQSLLHS